jgi:hypothetical protein
MNDIHAVTGKRRAFTVNLTAKQLYCRLARSKDCAAIRRPPAQPDILEDVLGLRRVSENGVIESGRFRILCWDGRSPG